MALSQAQAAELSLDMCLQALKGYRKDGLGADLWSATELKAIPNVCKAEVADAMQFSVRCIAWPHQNLLSLNPCLGKPDGGIRTICKTPMTYRIACRARKEVAQWEIGVRTAF